MIDEVVAPLLHNSEAAGGLTERVEVPLQLLTTVTTGIAGIDLGAAALLPAALVHPFTVVVTE